jgi:hypothetical protein
MKIKVILCVSTILIWSIAIQPARAEIILEDWQEFAFPVHDVDDCVGEDGVVSGIVHYVITEMAGGYGVHINAQGIAEGDDSGNQWLFRDNLTEIVPISDLPTDFVGTYQLHRKAISQGSEYPDVVYSVRSHVTLIDGQLVVYFDEAYLVCASPQN